MVIVRTSYLPIQATTFLSDTVIGCDGASQNQAGVDVCNDLSAITCSAVRHLVVSVTLRYLN